MWGGFLLVCLGLQAWGSLPLDQPDLWRNVLIYLSDKRPWLGDDVKQALYNLEQHRLSQLRHARLAKLQKIRFKPQAYGET